MQALQTLLADGIVDEILGQLKSGKEADVWLVSHNGETVAAKVYKEREFRSFKNNAGYKEGREVRNTRTQRAMNNGSRFGQKASEDAWKSAEADTLTKLYESGARVPKPVLFYEGVLLMEVIVDAESRVAPRLVDAAITIENAAGLYTLVREQAVKMLCADLIHGDLSEFNVLLAHNGPVVIDFPQVVAAAKNSQSEHFFKRDIENVRRFFANADPALNARVSDADEIWRAYVRRDLAPDFVPSGRAPVAQEPRRGGKGRGPQQQQAQLPSQNQQRGPDVSFRGAPGQLNEQRGDGQSSGANTQRRDHQPPRERTDQGSRREPFNRGDQPNDSRRNGQAAPERSNQAPRREAQFTHDSRQPSDPTRTPRDSQFNPNQGPRRDGQGTRGSTPPNDLNASRRDGQPKRDSSNQGLRRDNQGTRGGSQPNDPNALRRDGQPNRDSANQGSRRDGQGTRGGSQPSDPNASRLDSQPTRNGPNQGPRREGQVNRHQVTESKGDSSRQGVPPRQRDDSQTASRSGTGSQRPQENRGPPPNPGGGPRRRRRRYF